METGVKGCVVRGVESGRSFEPVPFSKDFAGGRRDL